MWETSTIADIPLEDMKATLDKREMVFERAYQYFDPEKYQPIHVSYHLVETLT